MTSAEITVKPRVLVVDDDAEFLQGIRLYLEDDYAVRVSVSGEDAIRIQREGWPDVILLDIEFPGMDGIAALEELRKVDSSVPVIMVTAHEEVRLVVEAMRKGAYQYVSKAENPALLAELISKALRHWRLEKKCEYLTYRREAIRGVEGAFVVGPAEASKSLLREIETSAGADVGVLVHGETGTGKELVARLIHQKSDRADGPFVAVDVPALPSQLLESELFGHEKGAFTGAVNKRIGAFEAASGGTIFLDEISEMPLSLQPKLLRALQQRTVRRLGSSWTSEVKCDVRVICATNRNLESMVAQGKFRADLYARLRIVEINVPPLRERRGDIRVLAQHFIEKHRAKTGARVMSISEEVLREFQSREWPLNVRELENEIVAAMVRARGTTLSMRDLSKRAGESSGGKAMLTYAEAKSQVVTGFKREYLRRALDEAHGVVNQAARRAGLSQASFRKMMKQAGLSPKRKPD